jgi:transcriptional regulator with XRE-family HTH domain
MKRKDLLITELTQMEIAERVGVAQPLISRWFSGKCMPRPETIKRIATALEVSEKELLVYLYEKHQNLARL